MKKTFIERFNTSKFAFDSVLKMRNEIEYLYNHAPISDIELLFSKYNMPLSSLEVLNRYSQLHDIDSLINYYSDKYDRQLDELSQKDLIFDDDCVLLFIERIINDNYDTSKLADMSFICEAIENMDGVKKVNIKKLTQIISNINQLQNYINENDLYSLFTRHYLDIEEFLLNCLFGDLINRKHKKDEVDSLVNQLVELTEKYSTEIDEELFFSALKLKLQFGFNNCKDFFYKCLDSIPSLPITFHLEALKSFDLQNIKDNEDFINLYNSAIKITPVSDDEEKALQTILKNFSL